MLAASHTRSQGVRRAMRCLLLLHRDEGMTAMLRLIRFKIDEIRLRLGMTWEEFAFHTGVKKQTLLRINRGGLVYVPIRALILIIRTCGVRAVSELIELDFKDVLGVLSPRHEPIQPRVVEFHLSSAKHDPVRGSTGSPREGAGITKERIGVWDVRTAAHITRELFRQYRVIQPDWIDRSSELDTRSCEEIVRGILERAKKSPMVAFVIGSPMLSSISEVFVSLMYGQTPVVGTVASRAAFPYTVQWTRSGTRPSSFCAPVDDPSQLGIVDTRTGEVVARFELVGDGIGEDCALIVTLLIPDPRDPTREPSAIVVLIGCGGPATKAAGEIAVDPAYLHELYPSKPGVPLMRAVRVRYVREEHGAHDTHDTRRIIHKELVPLSPEPEPPVQARAA